MVPATLWPCARVSRGFSIDGYTLPGFEFSSLCFRTGMRMRSISRRAVLLYEIKGSVASQIFVLTLGERTEIGRVHAFLLDVCLRCWPPPYQVGGMGGYRQAFSCALIMVSKLARKTLS